MEILQSSGIWTGETHSGEQNLLMIGSGPLSRQSNANKTRPNAE